MIKSCQKFNCAEKHQFYQPIKLLKDIDILSFGNSFKSDSAFSLCNMSNLIKRVRGTLNRHLTYNVGSFKGGLKNGLKNDRFFLQAVEPFGN